MHPLRTLLCWPLSGLALALAVSPAWADDPPASPRWLVSPDGAQLIDVRAKLVWSRCVEGMQWKGRTCVGQPMRVHHTQALALAAARRKAEGLAWRVPRVHELQRLVEHSTESGYNPTLLPQAPLDWHWTSTATVNMHGAQINPYNYGNVMQGRTNAESNHLNFLHGWAVHLGSGEARGDVTKRTLLVVRLVRTNQP